MSDQPFMLTPDDVKGVFKVLRVYCDTDDRQAYIFIYTDKGVRCVIHNYESDYDRFYKNLTLPCYLSFENGNVSKYVGRIE